MPEMPVDILNKELGAIRDNGDIDFDNTMAAVNIDTVLQEKFLFIPLEEIDAIEIEHTNLLSAGSGPENCQAGENENPNWLYNHAMNALALHFRIKATQEAKQAAIAKRPVPGVYHARHSGARHYFAIIVTADRSIMVPMEDGELCDQTEDYDAAAAKGTPWTTTHINITAGRFSA
jgi:hypothetical protein